MSKPGSGQQHLEVGLNAVIVSMASNLPMVLNLAGRKGARQNPDPIPEPSQDQSPPQEKEARQEPDSLPFGPFDPVRHRTMETGLRRFVEEQTGMGLGYVEQLYTFGDRGRLRKASDDEPHVISIGYLALTRPNRQLPPHIAMEGAQWTSWYHYFPWEDWREGRPAILDDVIIPQMLEWAQEHDSYGPQYQGLTPLHRVQLAFGASPTSTAGKWDEELVLDRYELLYSAGLLEESIADQRVPSTGLAAPLGKAMMNDHRRILATAISRLRGKLKYRPVIFELMAGDFTLLQLQQTVESIFGKAVHKQNFRRLVENTHLVEPTGKTSTATGGRPAALFRFRREVIQERPSPGLRVTGRG